MELVETSPKPNVRIEFGEKDAPVGVSNEIINKVRSTVARFETQITELRNKQRECKKTDSKMKCSIISNQMEVYYKYLYFYISF